MGCFYINTAYILFDFPPNYKPQLRTSPFPTKERGLFSSSGAVMYRKGRPAGRPRHCEAQRDAAIGMTDNKQAGAHHGAPCGMGRRIGGWAQGAEPLPHKASLKKGGGTAKPCRRVSSSQSQGALHTERNPHRPSGGAPFSRGPFCLGSSPCVGPRLAVAVLIGMGR